MKKRVLSLALALCMTLSLLPGQAFALSDDEQGAQVIDLPVVPEGEEVPEPWVSEHSMSTFASTAYAPVTNYVYEGQDEFYCGDDLIILDPDTYEPVTTAPENNGVIQLLDEEGNVAATSETVTHYSNGAWVDDGTGYEVWTILSYYISYFRVKSSGSQDLTSLPAGVYSLQYVCGANLEDVYPCLGYVEIVSSDDLLITSAYTSLYLGYSTADISLSVYGFQSEDELAQMTFNLLDETGAVVGSTTGSFKDFNIYDSCGVTQWNLYAELKLAEDYELVRNGKYTLQIVYTGDRKLYDGVGSANSYAYEPNIEVTGLTVLDPQTSRVKLTFESWDSEMVYTIHVSNNGSSGTLYGSYEGTIPESGAVELTLGKNGLSLPMTSLSNYLYVEVYEEGETYSTASNSFENPYRNLSEGNGNAYFQPSMVSSSAKSLKFTLSLQDIPAWQGKGDVLTLLDHEGNVAATCTSLTVVEEGEYETIVSGTFTFKTGLTEGEYSVYLNGVDLDAWLRASSGLSMSRNSLMRGYDDNTQSNFFYLNFGQFPLTYYGINSGGSGTILIQDADGTTVLTSGKLTGAVGEHDGYLYYNYAFTADDFAKLTAGETYKLIFRAANGQESEITLGTYSPEKVPLDLANGRYNQYYLDDYAMGNTTLTMELCCANENLRNLTDADLDVVKGLSIYNENSGTTLTVTGHGNGRWDEGHYYYLVDLYLSGPLLSGSNYAYYDGVQAYNLYISEPREEDTTPTIYNSIYYTSDGYIRGEYLPEDGEYTAKLYSGYTCLTEKPFALTLKTFSADSQRLYFPEDTVAGLAEGDYEMRVYLDGALMDSVTLTAMDSSMPVVEICMYSPKGHPSSLINGYGYYYFEVYNGGLYTKLRAANSPEELDKAYYYDISDEMHYYVHGEAGEKTVYVQLQTADGKTESEVLTFTFWYTAGQLLSVDVHEDFQGIYGGSTISFALAADCRCANAWAELVMSDGSTIELPLSYDGLGELPGLYSDKEAILESDHNYGNNMDIAWTYTVEGASRLEVTFSPETQFESNWDYLYVYAGSIADENLVGKYSGTDLAGVTLTIPSDTISLRLTSDGSGTYYGFAVTSIVDPDAPVEEEPEDTSSYKHIFTSQVLSTTRYNNSVGYIKDLETIRFYLTDENDQVISNVVERSLIFGSPDQVILPQFRDSYETVYATGDSFTVYGYATPGSTVSLLYITDDPLTTTAGVNGYFSFELTDLPDDEYYIYVEDDSYVTSGTSASFTVDTTAPAITGAEFAFGSSGTATLTWTYSGYDIDYFTLHRVNAETGAGNSIDSRIYDSNEGSITYTVSASEDDGWVFIIRAYDRAGNVGERTISTADQYPPTAPETVTVAAATTNSITLSWTEGTDNKGVQGYDVYMDGEVIAKAVSGLTYTVTGLGSGETCTFAIKTRDKAGNTSDLSMEVEGTTVKLTVTPNVESSYVVDLYPHRHIPVSCSVTADAEGYTPRFSEIWMEYRLSGSSGEWTVVELSTGGSGSWYIGGDEEDGFLPKGRYDLFFYATDTHGVTVVSDPATVVVLSVDEEAPSAPGAPAALSHTTASITFSWSEAEDNVGVAYYQIWRDGVMIADHISPSALSWTDTDVAVGTTYHYTVTAVDGRGNVSASSASSALNTLDLTFETVYDFEDSYVLEDQYGKTLPVDAMFKPEEGYAPDVTVTLEYRPSGGESWTALPMTVSAEDPNYFTAALKGDKLKDFEPGRYDLRFAVTDGVATAYSQVQTVKLTPETVPPVVSSLTPAGDTYGGKQIDLSAYASDNVGVVEIIFSYAAEGSKEFTEITRVSTGGTARYSWDASALASGIYTLKAAARDARGNTGEKTVVITIDNTPPALPTGLTATPTSRYIHVNWDTSYAPSTDFFAFRVYRATAESGPYTMVSERRSIGYYDGSKTAEDGVTYYYYVTAVDSYGNESQPSGILSATFIEDSESPTIIDMLPRAGEGLRKEVTIQVAASDNYRLSTAIFYYRPNGGSWTEIGRDTVDGVTDAATFTLNWTIPASITRGSYEIKVLVYDSSYTEVDADSGYLANAPAEWIRTVTIYPYSAPAAPAVTAQADYKSAELSWTYSGDTDTLRQFVVYRTNASGGERKYVAAVPAGKSGSCTVTIPSEGEQYFVVEAKDNYGISADSKVTAVTSAPKETVPPVAVLQPETLTAAAGVPFTFSGVNSTDNDVIVSYRWNFGDGATGEGDTCAHTYAAPGTYTVTLTVTDESENSATATATMTVYDIAAEDATHSLVTLRIVNAFLENTPGIEGASVKIYVEDASGSTTFETTATADADGVVTAVLPADTVTVSVTAEGFIATSRSVAVTPDENGCFSYTVGMTPMNVSLVDGSLSVEEMTYDEIRAAGIDVTDPDNNHVWKFAATLQFVAGPAFPFDLPELDVTGFFNSKGSFLGGTGWGWTTLSSLSGGGGATGWGMNIGVFPISEHFLLVIYGEAHWLKEMYNVELIVINNSYVDDITDCEAQLTLPDGLSLAAMTGKAQSNTVEIGTIPHKTSASDTANTAKVNWYVRGDKEGEYNLTATVTGKNPEPFVKSFTTDKPVKVYAGSALKLYITAGDIAYRGEEYHVRFELVNVSHKDLYNLSFGITGAEQFKVVQLGDATGELLLNQDDFGDSMTRSIDVLEPGGSIVIDFYTTTWFNSALELVDLGPFDVGYYLTDVFVTTLEGSSTTIPCEINIEHVSHGSFFEWLVEQGKEALDGKFIDLLDEYLFEKVPFVSTAKKIYEFASEDTGDTASHCTITINGGYFTGSNNFLRSRSAPMAVLADSTPGGAVSVYTDGTYSISPDGKTMTIEGGGKLYVEAENPGVATMEVTTWVIDEDGTEIPHTHIVEYTVSGDKAVAEDLVLQAPTEGVEDGNAPIPLAGNTSRITFPYLLMDGSGGYLTDADNAQWTITGEDTTGLSVEKGVLTIQSKARAGQYTVTLSVGGKTASQTITLTREPPVLTDLRICRDGAAMAADDVLTLPADGSVTRTYTAVGIDQYGVEFEIDVTWTVSGNTSGAVVSNGSLTLTGDTTPGELILTAASGNKSDSVRVVIMDEGALVLEEVSTTATRSVVSLTNTSQTAVPVQAFVAAYDADGRMVACGMVTVVLDGSDSVELPVSFTEQDGVTDIRVFLLNDTTMAPLRTSWSSN